MVDPSCLSRSPKKFSTLVIIRVNGFVLNKAEHDRRQSEHSSSFSLERVGMFCDPPLYPLGESLGGSAWSLVPGQVAIKPAGKDV